MFWTTTTIADHQRGLRHRGGRLVRWLEPGRHLLWWPREGTHDVTLDLTDGHTAYSPELAAVVPAGTAEVLDVGYEQLAILEVDGRPTRALSAGRYLLFQERAEVSATLYDTDGMVTEIPERVWHLVPADVLLPIIVHPYERVVLYVDGHQADVLEPGRHGIHRSNRTVLPVRVDLRDQELQIVGQDVMSNDKVSLRINVIVRYRIADAARALSTVANLHDALYASAQLAARRLVAGSTLDELLEGRNVAADQLKADVVADATPWGVDIVAVDLKDIVLPGEMKAILNQVIEAEKRAAAHGIQRREETAATRSLANTAKLLAQNPVLVRLKELEAMERLAENVGQVTIVASTEQLVGSLKLPG